MRRAFSHFFMISLFVFVIILLMACVPVASEGELHSLPNNQNAPSVTDQPGLPGSRLETPIGIVNTSPDFKISPITVLESANGMNGTVPLWSPTRDQLLLDCVLDRSALTILDVPELHSKIISKRSGCWQGTWSPNGQLVAFIDQNDDLQIALADSSNIHLVTSISSLRLPINIQWVDTNRLIYKHYQGGGHSSFTLLEISSGITEKIATIPGGTMAPYYADYLPVTSEIGVADYRLIVLSNLFPTSEEMLPKHITSGHYRLFPLYQSTNVDEAWTSYNGWLPGTNQLLVAWKQYKIPGEEVQQEALLFWDVSTNQISVAAPNGIEGILSPDGKYLAYLTRGPAILNPQNKPIHNEKADKFILWSVSPLVPTYMQLLELASGKVILSVPAKTLNFSPNSKYFAFFVQGELPKDVEFYLNGIQPVDGYGIYIIDLAHEKSILMIDDAASLPVWSPVEDKFLYEDDNGEIILFDVLNQHSTKILQLLKNEMVRAIRWSHEGDYFFISLVTEKETSIQKIVIIKSHQ
jgi:hypothetical protein